jgi:hypothetical protein
MGVGLSMSIRGWKSRHGGRSSWLGLRQHISHSRCNEKNYNHLSIQQKRENTKEGKNARYIMQMENVAKEKALLPRGLG